MSQPKQHQVTELLRRFATKLAADGAPDRMTVADGQGGITASKGTVPHDGGEDLLKSEQPTDGTNRQVAAVPTGGPDRMTVADGQGGITASKGTVPKDPGEAELKVNQPADGISKKAAAIRAALLQANPGLADQLGKQAGNPSPTAPAPQAPASVGADIDLSSATLAKIASAVLSTDEGIRFVHDTLEKQAGEEAARLQIREAIEASRAFDRTEQVKAAAFNDVDQKARAIYASLVADGVTEQDADAIIKQAAFHQQKMASFSHPLIKQAYAQGMDDAALLAAADDAGGAEGMPPVEEAMPMGGEELSEEEILLLIQEMLASGQITEDDIAQAVAATGGEGAAPEGGAAEGAPEAETVPV